MDFARVRVRLLSLLLLRTDNYVLLGGDDGDALTASPKSPSPLPPFFCHPPSTIRQNQSMATVRDMPRTVAAGVGDLASSHLCIYRLACCSVSSARCLLSKRPEFGILAAAWYPCPTYLRRRPCSGSEPARGGGGCSHEAGWISRPWRVALGRPLRPSIQSIQSNSVRPPPPRRPPATLYTVTQLQLLRDPPHLYLVTSSNAIRVQAQNLCACTT